MGSNCKSSIWLALGTALVLSFYSVGTAWAGGDLETAKKEGKVVWYSSIALPIAQEVCNTFNKEKWGFECVLHRSGSGKIFKRWMEEAKSNVFTADVIHTANSGHFVSLQKKGAIIQYRPKGTDRFPAEFKGPDGYWMILRAFAYVPAYNKSKVKADDIPRSWLDLLKPKWGGGKLVSAHPNYSGAVSVGMAMLVKKFGWEFMDRLAAMKPRVVQSILDTTAYVARGEALIASGSATFNNFVAAEKGAPIVAILPKEGVPFITSPQAILKKAPHPNAAKIFSDWLFSLEAQQILANRGLYVGHPDVKYPAAQVPLKKLKLLTMSPQEAAKMRKPVREAFVKKFKT